MSIRIKNEYMLWLMRMVNTKEHRSNQYKKLFNKLYDRQFHVINAFDENRVMDGEDMRYRFGDEMGYPNPEITESIDDRPCSILELMIALAYRMENQFAYDPQYGDRTGFWFWEMVNSLGLINMTDDSFDERYVNTVIDQFISLDYKPNGEGGLFTIKDPKKDYREVQIWYQMCEYLNQLLF